APAPTLPGTAPPQPKPPSRNTLPLMLTRFFGREEEIARLLSLLSPKEDAKEPSEKVTTPRLITLTGPGGAGKTRLAVEVARRLSGDVGRGAGRPHASGAAADVDLADYLKAAPECGGGTGVPALVAADSGRYRDARAAAAFRGRPVVCRPRAGGKARF